jgi:signal transduction histidine kinase
MENRAKDQFLKPVSSLVESKESVSGGSQQAGRTRLADFVHENTEQIVKEWEAFARTLIPASTNMTPLALRDHIYEILIFIVKDIRSAQTPLEQIKKSRGENKKNQSATAAETHAALRLAGGFDIDQMVSEYRALRASVVKLWSATHTHMSPTDVIDLTRFNEAIDQELAESVSHYTHKVGYSKDLFMGILSHDLRNPLGAISMAAHLMLNLGELNERQTMLATQITESTDRTFTIVNDLLDVTRARFGAGLPVIRVPMDMGFLSHQIVEEMRIIHPSRVIVLGVSGDVKGEWGKARIGQVFSNLISNALQYSFKDSPVSVSVKGMDEEVVVSVHNYGTPIRPEKIGTIFNALTRVSGDKKNNSEIVNLGLGLYITHDIVVSHGGTIDVLSSEEKGTTFTARFPR